MSHYVALLVPSSAGEWRVVIPDFPECDAHGRSIDEATYAALTSLLRCAAENGHRPPRDLSDIQRDTEWLSRHCVDLDAAVVTMISV